MDTMGTRIALGTIILLLLLLLCLPYLSTAEAIYSPHDLFSIICGSPTNSSSPDGRNWTEDIKFLSAGSQNSTAAPQLRLLAAENPYKYARLSYSNFTYSIPVTAGPKFIRLFFYPTSYLNFDPSKAYFTVKAGEFTLLRDFDAYLNDGGADVDDPDGSFMREYCINFQDDQNLNITFIPSTADSYAFINGIEVVSMPPYLYYTSPDVDIDELPQLVGWTARTYNIQNNYALETMYRLTSLAKQLTPSEDTGMLRTWNTDKIFVTSLSGDSTDYGNIYNLTFTNMTPNYTAPDKVYQSVRTMGTNASWNMMLNLTWQLPVDSGFYYSLRLHFCELDPNIWQPGDMMFSIYIQDQLATYIADVLGWTRHKGVPVVKQYVLFIPRDRAKVNISLKMHPYYKSTHLTAQVSAIEVFKINDSSGSLAGTNPSPQTLKDPIPTTDKKSSGTTRTLAAVAGAVSGVVLISIVIAFFLIKRKKSVAVDMGSKQKDGTSRGGGSSSLPTNLCRYFSIAEIKAATNNFDELFVVGIGGFGNVYKGYIDDGSTPVAVKRLKPGSQQGINEFVNEIEMLSQLRHLHLVSLIGYCYESNEMILVYDFMDRGTLRNHLYDSDSPSLSWKQRLKICIGAARGLHYLHTGAKHMIIHRDVKSTNILLDEKWVAKVSDFGLSRIGPTGTSMTHVSTQVKGSIGYLDPEYYKRQRLTEKSDVYSFGVVLLEVLSGRQPLLRMVEKQQVSLVDWAKHQYQKGSLGEIVDPALKDQIAPECLRKFGEIALSCLLEDGTQRPSMNDVVGVLEFVLQLQESALNNGVVVSGGGYEDNEDMFSSSHTSLHASDYSNSTGLNTTSSDSCGSKESDRLIPENVFSEIKNPKGR